MRKRILELLRNSKGTPVSGEEISKELEVSRTAIWKHIQALKNEGYEIESVPKRGYILREVPDRLFPQEILSHLQTKWLGRNICYRDSVDSSNNLAKALANEGCENGLLVVAEEQGAGKGRLSRGWISPYAKGIWFSVVLKPPFLPQEASKCTLLAAVAVVKAINKIAGVHAAIKWPNDILLLGRKLVGILTEMNAEFGHINYVVIGTGINTSASPEDYPEEVRYAYAQGGRLAGEHGIGAKKLAYMEEFTPAGELELMRRIKLAWDPNLILNPGKVFNA